MVRLFFEQAGFLVTTNLPYQVKGKIQGITGTSDLDLVVSNPKTKKAGSHHLPFQLAVDHLAWIKAATVEVKGWHTEEIVPSLIASRDLLNFTRTEAKRAAKKLLGTNSFRQILVVSRLTEGRTRERSIQLLKDAGVNHVIEFKTVVDALVSSVEEQRYYRDSEVMQTIRVLSIYKELQ